MTLLQNRVDKANRQIDSFVVTQNDAAPKHYQIEANKSESFVVTQNDAAPKLVVIISDQRIRFVVTQNDAAPKRKV